MITLHPLGTLTFTMAATRRLGDTPVGARVVVDFIGARVEGERLRASQVGVAGDWLTVGADGVATLDIRLTLETDDGALIFVHGAGRTHAGRFAREGGPMYFTPRFETGDARYRWLNEVQAVAKGMAQGDAATFELYALE